jgi:hypothetical protein
VLLTLNCPVSVPLAINLLPGLNLGYLLRQIFRFVVSPRFIFTYTIKIIYNLDVILINVKEFDFFLNAIIINLKELFF